METGELLNGRYRLVDRLGAGGMSVVWRAHDEVLGRDVAVKMLSTSLAADPHLLRRVRLEARSAARLRHPNIVEVYDYGETTDAGGRRLPYVVMELVEGRSLAQLLTGGALPWRVAVLTCAQVAAALAAAHDRGIVHRDVKPANVMVTAAGVKLVDFGVSAASGDADGPAGPLLGTPAYLAPERLSAGVVQPATDVYALGLLLYRALAGTLPWRASTTTQMLTAHRYQEPAVLPPVDDLPPEVAELCRSCLDKDPGQRPGAAELARRLGGIAGLPPATLVVPDRDVAGGTGLAEAAAPLGSARATDLTRVAVGLLTAPPHQALRARWHGLSAHARRQVVAVGVVALLALTTAGASWVVAASGRDDEPSRVATPAAVTGMGERKPECSVRYTVRGAVNGRFSSAVSVSNTGTTPIDDWQLTFDLPGEQRLLSGSPGTWRQTGRSVQVRGGDLPAKKSFAGRFDGTYRGVNALPTAVTLNGTRCQLTFSVAGQTTRPDPPEDKGRDDKGKKKDEGKKDDEKKDEEKDDD
ncbi:serine/threonine-protein kinase [Micromonospora sp. C28SCA-DRY-2]|uniref:serine/threonine-protein kinase n=1 Tax=Micromonospora sp. C28SCA-DRY-2 TaxID=3059522 RepID=UPI002675684B|nr:serine/threonine-protein kinase [Micromonospora sp. C28SCA-DRY-2]MDO3704028.1 serine/threonine-protein kinase [Micromonospora sp. C28SCA-DRY-2]